MNMSLSKIAVVVLGALLLLAPSDAHAHHPHFKKAFELAINARDFNALRHVFSEDAWHGKKGSVAGNGLHEWVKHADRVVLAKGPQANLSNLVMGLEFFRLWPERPGWIFVLATPVAKSIVVHVGEKRFACQWRVIRLTKSFKEAEAFLKRPLKYIKPSPSPATGGKQKDAILSAVASLNDRKPDKVRAHSRGTAWERESVESPRAFHEEMGKRNLTAFPFRVHDKGDRASVRIWMWSQQNHQYETNRFVLLIRDKDKAGKPRWLIEAVTTLEDREKTFLNGSE